MQIFYHLQEWKQKRHIIPNSKSIGFIPTMGNLHKGHASLYKKSIQENDCTVASIFINPTQFNNKNDFSFYPRTLDEDLALLESLGVDYCIVPNETSIYPDNYNYQIHETVQQELMEGKVRPGHFTGVLTVVMKLFNLVKPHKAYFGEKDFQQLQLIRNMTKAFFMDIEIIACETIREDSNLACSSRNNRLSIEQRQLADIFAKLFHQNLTDSILLEKLTALGIEVEYLETHFNRRFIAINLNGIRLIDNYSIPGLRIYDNI